MYAVMINNKVNHKGFTYLVDTEETAEAIVEEANAEEDLEALYYDIEED